MGFAAGFILFHLAASSLAYISFPARFWQFIALASAAAAVSSLITHWLLTIIVTRFAPRASAQLMLGRTIDRPAPANAAPPLSPRTCESCGYQLEGLPATRCEKCSIVGLRCPECGHTQPANTLNARALRLIYRMHTAVRVITWLGGLGTIFCLLMIWFTVAKLVGLQQSFGRFTWEDGPGSLPGKLRTCRPNPPSALARPAALAHVTAGRPAPGGGHAPRIQRRIFLDGMGYHGILQPRLALCLIQLPILMASLDMAHLRF